MAVAAPTPRSSSASGPIRRHLSLGLARSGRRGGGRLDRGVRIFGVEFRSVCSQLGSEQRADPVRFRADIKFRDRVVRRLMRYDEDKEEDEFENNYDIVTLESYTEYKMNEALLVRAMVDNQEEQVLIFKGFSSSLSYGTSPDPSRSVLPARAVITSIDRVKGPFDPSNIEYIEKGLTLDAFKNRLQPNVPN
ncbi:hypothetical protein Syun_021914 [Stephania yunnanensis]|uniref:DUF7734 domain-containing protein n=1 Tax=Stephania yunnanensis TaxID=152371 RepID=A0AAP0NPJ1_9MAGN